MNPSASPAAPPSRDDDSAKSREELLRELSQLRREYVNLKILEEEHDRALAALREGEERYRQIVETATDIIYRISPEGYFTYANPVAVRIIGYDLNEIIGKNYIDLIRPDFRKKAIRHYLQQTRERIPSTYFEFPAMAKDGREVWLGQNVQIILYDDQIIELQAVARDLTEMRKAGEERQALELQLIQAQKMVSAGRLAGGIAHDFNNILGIILAYTNLLEERNLPPEKAQMSLDAITRAVERAKGMIRQLLTLARKSDPSLEYVEVNDAVKAFMHMITETFPRTIDFATAFDESNPGILADQSQFQQILLNLFVNARDAMPQGGRLEVSTLVVNEITMSKKFAQAQLTAYVSISVRDTGTGMDEATKARVFEPFFSTKEHGLGSGLGLAVVYGIIQGHRGIIDVESTPGAGSVFHVYFPLAAPAPTKVRTEADDPGHLSGSETILVVEDEELLRDVISGILTQRGYTVLSAGDGISAVDLFMKHQHNIAVVLSDLGLPKLGGWEACVTMKEINARVPIIVASGFVEPRLRAEIQRTGAQIVQKPYQPVEVLRTIRTVLDTM
ncbi:MAG: PAS domain S-box protein [Ignavibacteriales bacterium]|nr:PAS domain S-box protein [Ignavibacteriales bacterium]